MKVKYINYGKHARLIYNRYISMCINQQALACTPAQQYAVPSCHTATIIHEQTKLPRSLKLPYILALHISISTVQTYTYRYNHVLNTPQPPWVI